MSSTGASGPAPVAGCVGRIVPEVFACFSGPADSAWGGEYRFVTEIAEPAVAELAGPSTPWDFPWPWAATKIKLRYFFV